MSLREDVNNQAANIANEVDHGECFYSKKELYSLLDKLDKLKELSIAYYNENRVRDVRVFQVNESDAVAAESLEDAKDWYMQEHNMSAEDAFYDYEANEVPLTHAVWQDENRTKKEVLSDLILEFWQGVPFRIFTTEG